MNKRKNLWLVASVVMVLSLVMAACEPLKAPATPTAPAAPTTPTAPATKTTPAPSTEPATPTTPAPATKAEPEPTGPAVVQQFEEPIGTPPAVGWKWVVAEFNSDNESSRPSQSHDFFWVYYVVKGSTELTTNNTTKKLASGEAMLVEGRQLHEHRYFPQSKLLQFDVRDSTDRPTAFHQGRELYQSDNLTSLTPGKEYKLRIRQFTLAPNSRTKSTGAIDPNFLYVVEGSVTITTQAGLFKIQEGTAFSLPLSTGYIIANESGTPVKFVLADVHP
ncbi:MAG: hypothetical protein HY663_04955 [Chloroflexi bacterium]|nr:hypothetical protein [Chloroflexota bacterium]